MTYILTVAHQEGRKLPGLVEGRSECTCPGDEGPCDANDPYEEEGRCQCQCCDSCRKKCGEQL